MSWNELLAAALTLVIGFVLQWALKLINVEIDPVLFKTLVAGIVTALLALFGVQLFKRAGVKGLR